MRSVGVFQPRMTGRKRSHPVWQTESPRILELVFMPFPRQSQTGNQTDTHDSACLGHPPRELVASSVCDSTRSRGVRVVARDDLANSGTGGSCNADNFPMASNFDPLFTETRTRYVAFGTVQIGHAVSKDEVVWMRPGPESLSRPPRRLGCGLARAFAPSSKRAFQDDFFWVR